MTIKDPDTRSAIKLNGRAFRIQSTSANANTPRGDQASADVLHIRSRKPIVDPGTIKDAPKPRAQVQRLTQFGNQGASVLTFPKVTDAAIDIRNTPLDPQNDFPDLDLHTAQKKNLR